MLSYMLPVDEKPPPGPGKAHLQLTLDPITTNGRTNGTTSSSVSHHSILNNPCLISKENSISSFGSDATASHSSAASRSKIVLNGGKHQSLKRVSFGSSKGSMVETLIFETPVQEEPETSPNDGNATPFPADQDQTEDEREKVRVSFVQQSKPQEVVLPDEPIILTESEFIMAAAALNESNHVVSTYTRQGSTDSGWDNPFRPDGDLSKEADEIVEQIKSGKPITPVGNNSVPLVPSADLIDSKNTSTPITESPKKKKVANSLAAAPAPAQTQNKSAKNGNVQSPHKGDGSVDVQRGTTLPAAAASEVEHVIIKKKPKCKCCVIS